MENNLLKKFDQSFISNDISIIAGVDEAGRGPLSGPVVAAAVIFANEKFIDGINDSKQVKEKDRTLLFDKIKSGAICYGIGIVDNKTIDEINILQATLKAMKIAVDNLRVQPNLILIDGNKSFNSKTAIKTIVKGDTKSFAVAAASILAKVTRDKLVIEAAEKYPNYDWCNNKGYGTKKHVEAIKKYGTTPLHRKTFLKNILSTNSC